MKTIRKKPFSGLLALLLVSVFFVTCLQGCTEELEKMLDPTFHPQGSLDKDGNKKTSQTEKTEYYNKFFDEITQRKSLRYGTLSNISMDNLPKGHGGEVNWTAAVIDGFISPRGSLDPNAEEEPPLDLNIFIEAKVPLMANVLFPHSIHTYWLSCSNCHPGIFTPQAGSNDISMKEIFEGKWCGRCHDKVAFKFFPIANCRRCHIIMKGQSLEVEHYN